MTSLLDLLESLYSLGSYPSTSVAHPLIQKIKNHPDCTPAIGNALDACYTHEPGWLFGGADFNSLEDYISALTTKDPAKLKVYAGLKQYKITVNGKTQIINEDDVVSYDGKQLTGEQLYELLQSSPS